jgi:hypothetical protein
MARQRPVDQIIRILLIAGALVFALLLSGIGSGLLTRPAPYHPSTPASSVP